MDKNELVALGIRISALFFIFYLIRDGSNYIYLLASYQEENIWFFWASGILLFFFLAAVLVIKFPLLIAGQLLPKVAQSHAKIKYSLDDIQEVAFTILGLFVLVTAVPDLFYWFIMMQQYISTYPPKEYSPQDLANIVSTVIEFIIGFWLLFGAKGLRGLLNKFRTAGLPK